MTIGLIYEGGRSDKYWAWAISISLHLAVAMWALIGTSETRQKQSYAGMSSAPLSSRFLGEDEFRQPLVAASLTKPLEDSASKPETGAILAVDPAIESPAATVMEAMASVRDAPTTHEASASATQDTGISGHESPTVSPQFEPPHYDPNESAYLTALRAAIQSKWIRQDRQNGRCSVTIQQTIGGRVVGATSRACMLSDADRRALEAAALAAQPLPYAGFEQVFQEHLTVQMGE